jgi:hypothetical protein
MKEKPCKGLVLLPMNQLPLACREPSSPNFPANGASATVLQHPTHLNFYCNKKSKYIKPLDSQIDCDKPNCTNCCVHWQSNVPITGEKMKL